MFSWFTRHVAYFFFWRRQPSGFQKGKGTGLSTFQDDSKFFWTASLSAYTPWVFFAWYTPFWILQSVTLYTGLRFFSGLNRRNFFYPCMAKKWRGLLHALSILIFFSENAPFLVCGSLEYQISHPRLQASYFLPGNNEFVLSKKTKKEKYTRKLSHWLINGIWLLLFFFSMMW